MLAGFFANSRKLAHQRIGGIKSIRVVVIKR